MPRTPEEGRALFDRWARTYDLDLAGQDGPKAGPLVGYAETLRIAAEQVPVAPGMSVLDVGIGTGAFAARFRGRGVRVSGVDPSPAMLDACRGKHPGFTLRVGDFNAIPFDSGEFDMVISSFAFHEVPPGGRLAACRELARVLKPGGALCLVDILFASPAALAAAREAIGERWDDEEDYPLVGDLDQLLHEAGIGGSRWRQTAPCHWMVLARKPA
ncbi:class I SAM-dependent methyltransferase [Symbiobacterium thermophilum]|nr:class I SAM-dependent methyltransferase [Symbiobacterium thermophilum]